MKHAIAAAAILMASLSSARTINKVREEAPTPSTVSPSTNPPDVSTPNRQAFELDVTSANLGLQDYYSRDDGYIVVKIEAGDVLQSATVRSVGDNVICTIRDTQGFQIRKFGGADLSDTYDKEDWEPPAGSIGCFFEDDVKAQ
jgi:hypothetical protein